MQLSIYMYLVLIILILLVFNINGQKDIECPQICKCDMFEKHRRATCKNQKLVVIEADVPPQVQLLDMSYNIIRELSDHIFINANLASLKRLNLSHNKIGQIHENAFINLKYLKSVDLSYNNMEYILKDWFWNTPLIELYLERNNFKRLLDGPILDSKSLKMLDLNDCSLLSISKDAFSQLPNLKKLDISKNNLIQLHASVFLSLSNLQVLKLENNPWHCNEIIEELISYLKKKHIKYDNPCSTALPSSNNEKFQRMIVASNIPLEEPQNTWIYDEQPGEKMNNTIISICTCEDAEEKTIVSRFVRSYPVLFSSSIFIFGFFLGMIIYYLVSLTRTNQRKLKPIRRYRRNILRKRIPADVLSFNLLSSEEFNLSNTTPIPMRKDFIRKCTES